MRNNNQTGASLVLAILIMGAVSAVAVTLSVLIVNEVGTTTGINHAMKAFYSAESAIEQGTWIIHEARRTGRDIVWTVDQLNNPGAGALEDPSVVWARQASDQYEDIVVDLRQDESVFLDLYNPAGGLPPRKINCLFDEFGGTTNVEISWSGWSLAPNGFCPETTKWYPAQCDGTLQSLETVPCSQAVRYRVQIRAFDGPATNLTLRVYEDDGITPINIPSKIMILAKGTYPNNAARSATQALRADVQWTVAVSGLFSYVLFSDQPLQKTP